MRRPFPPSAWLATALTLWLPSASQGYELLVYGVVSVGGEVTATNHVLLSSGGLSLAGLSTGGSLEEFSGLLFPQLGSASSVEESEIPVTTQFRGVGPNPFRIQTTIRFDIASSERGDPQTRFAIYDVTGRSVRILLNDHVEPGRYAIQWDGTNEQNQPVLAGVYFGRFSSGDLVRTIRLVRSK